MKILIVTSGTRGGVQPYIALGQALMASDNKVTICTHTHFEPLIRKGGLDYAFGDQPYWGRYVARLGVGPPPITQKRLTVDRLCHAIDVVMNDAAIRQKAAALGDRIRNEDGSQCGGIHNPMDEQPVTSCVLENTSGSPGAAPDRGGPDSNASYPRQSGPHCNSTLFHLS